MGIGERREFAGVHFLSDTRTGVDLALQLKELILQKAEFKVLGFVVDCARSSTFTA